MRKLYYLTAAGAAMLFVLSSSVSAGGAGSTYKGLAEDNPDLTGNPQLSVSSSGHSTPSKSANVYKGLDEGNKDLVSPIETDKTPTKKNPDIYGEAEPAPDLTY